MVHPVHKTRAQHFVSSPRKIASPLRIKVRHKGSTSGLRHPLKRRRVGEDGTEEVDALEPGLRPVAGADEGLVISSDEDDVEETEGIAQPPGRPGRDARRGETSRAGASRSAGTGRSAPLTSFGGEQVVNVPVPPAEAAGPRARKGGRRKSRTEEQRPKLRLGRDVFASLRREDEGDSSSSPRKRKRHEREEEEGAAEAELSEAESGSWVEVEEEAGEEPDFIAESDQYLLHDAPVQALYRLKKAELVRLWKVAGMWDEDEDGDEAGEAMEDEDDDGGLDEQQLVDGLIGARRHSVDRFSTPASPARAGPALEFDDEPPHFRQYSSAPITPPSSGSSDQETAHVEATPRPTGRIVRGAKHQSAGNGFISERKRIRGKPKVNGSVYARSKSLGGAEGRKARFGPDVRSPLNGMMDDRPRRGSASRSSAYTTTDSSPAPDSAPRQPPRRKPGTKPRPQPGGRRLTQPAGSRPSAPSSTSTYEDTDDDIEAGEDVMELEADAPVEATPLIKRLRPRTQSQLYKESPSEVDADGEESAEDSPIQSSRRTRSRDKLLDFDVSMNAPGPSRRPRAAKKRAVQAIHDDASDEEDVEDEMMVDEPEGLDGEDEDQGEEAEYAPSPRITRSRTQSSQTIATLGSPPRRPTRRVSPHVFSKGGTLTPPPPDADDEECSSTELDEGSQAGDDGAVDGEVNVEEAENARITRSGRAFGQWQSRKNRLRQEAIEDPDMDVDDEDMEEESEEDDFEPDDFDLSDATVSSLTRMLRDELVQMCEARGIEVGGTKPQLAKALIQWRDEQSAAVDEESETEPDRTSGSKSRRSTTSSTGTARPGSSERSKVPTGRLIHAVASNRHKSGQVTPVLLRDHIHAADPETPPTHSEPESSKRTTEQDLNLDLAELGLEDHTIRPEQLQKLERIGSGGFKDVFVGKLRGRRVAISEFREHLSEMDIRELKLLAEFSHPNIVKFRGICVPEDSRHIPCMLVSELCENGDLFDYIRNVACPSVKRVLQLMLDIARGLEYLHTRSPAIIHRDCKSSNILINRSGTAKVGDFGLARVKNSTKSMIRSLVGTVNWQAPELWKPNPRYDYKVDVFSAAMVYWEMMSGWIGEKKYPWEGHNEHYIYDAVGAKQRRPSVAGMRSHWGDEPVNLMERMWHQDPKERPTMTDVVADLEALLSEYR